MKMEYSPFKENGRIEAAAPDPYPPLEVELSLIHI